MPQSLSLRYCIFILSRPAAAQTSSPSVARGQIFASNQPQTNCEYFAVEIMSWSGREGDLIHHLLSEDAQVALFSHLQSSVFCFPSFDQHCLLMRRHSLLFVIRLLLSCEIVSPDHKPRYCGSAINYTASERQVKSFF